eukprot:CAMPEP_0170548416 /NCGR_PEP_ID=MMETSP0211-20121228/6742_1 /TAXON_ID=311385 /ORGANISM="Pseudokeronopsis sp., Strain OXSARD2" /LENGTH=188 /DNA_ID=CAMNT_0010853971 /DNA_START=1173 /DNA_END=1739 /DNA_ORIENTATION=-
MIFNLKELMVGFGQMLLADVAWVLADHLDHVAELGLVIEHLVQRLPCLSILLCCPSPYLTLQVSLVKLHLMVDVGEDLQVLVCDLLPLLRVLLNADPRLRLRSNLPLLKLLNIESTLLAVLIDIFVGLEVEFLVEVLILQLDVLEQLLRIQFEHPRPQQVLIHIEHLLLKLLSDLGRDRILAVRSSLN